MGSLRDGGPDLATVPEFYIEFYGKFPITMERALRDHIAASDGFCMSCFKPWPCDIRQWVRTIWRVQHPDSQPWHPLATLSTISAEKILPRSV